MRPRKSILVVLLTIIAASPSSAEVISITANLRSLVQSSIDGTEDSFDESLEILDENGSTLPITTRANLESGSGIDDIQSEALAIAEFNDPGNSPVRNPQEFGAEANCFSLDNTSYTLETTITERRVIELTDAELNFPSGGVETVQSAIFPSGVISLWSLNERIDLTNLTGQLTFVVNRIELDDSGNETTTTQLVAQRVSLRGAGFDVTLEQTEDITVIAGGLDILPNDEIGDLDIDLDALATARVAIIPAQQIDYEYVATAGERFILEAIITINASNIAGGTGVTTVVGRPFDNAANIIDLGIPSPTARRLQFRMNRALSEFKPDSPPQSALESPVDLCGSMGIETAGMFAIVGGWRQTRRRRVRLRLRWRC